MVGVGLRRLATTYDGETVYVFENPKPLKQALTKLRRIHRRISRSLESHGRQRKSNRRERRYAEFHRQHLRVANLRLDAAHKATTAIAKRSRLVCGVLACNRLDAEPSVIAFDRGCLARWFFKDAEVEVPARGRPVG